MATLEAVKAAKAAAASARRDVFLHVKVETGTTRQGAELRDLPGIAAATILGDGRVALILDVDTLVAASRNADTTRLLQAG